MFLTKDELTELTDSTLDEHKPADLFRFVMPDLRGPLGRHPENEANRGGIWIPACAGMTAFFLD